jgi:hypothetical protein
MEMFQGWHALINFRLNKERESIMGLFYAASPKELLQIRNKIFLNFGLPALQKAGFQKSPFNSWFGKSDIGYTYELCRLSEKAELEIIIVHIVRGDRWIQISLNIFMPQPRLNSLQQLANVDGLKFHLPPNSVSNMRLRSDDIAGPPILNYNYMFRNHKIKSYHTKAGLEKRSEELGKIIERDLNGIDNFVKRWHELHSAITTTWDGVPINSK